MERGELIKLQPYFIENFFLAAFKELRAQIYKRGNGRYEILRVPAAISAQALKSDVQLPENYKRVCFDKKFCNIEGLDAAELLTLGHPLVSAVSALILEKYGEVLRQGTIFIDENNSSENFRLLFLIETKISDGRAQILSKKIQFVEIFEDGRAVQINPAAYLNYETPTDSERERILAAVQNLHWLNANVEEIANNYTVENLLPPYLQEVSARRLIYLDKLEREVKSRLTNEIQFLDMRALELLQKNKEESDKATLRADELAERLRQRLEKISLARNISAAAPVIVGGALIVPRGFLKNNFSQNLDARAKIEKIAMQAVMKIERELGNFPADVSKNNCGYDIESRTPENFLRFIEVKGRNADADSVTVTSNEICAALNSPENFILAIVKVDGNSTQIFYIKNPFTRPPDFNAISVNYSISALIGQGNIILHRKYFE